ncbi:MAG: peptide-methionine (S)-S-oxide reductase MsrA [Bacteroidetes bacterium]|nr:peptide-methionine (S)-S-oxide reductase MsrA [Bacteroidota bacterium]
MRKSNRTFLITLFATAFALAACSQTSTNKKLTLIDSLKSQLTDTSQLDTATLGAGCFWCVEAVFQRIEGVKSVKSGYTGGNIKNPSYREICTGRTGHAEVAQLVYDTKVISYAELLEVFLVSHDPTQLNRQGNDVGTQYRSSIFTHSEKQQRIAEAAIAAADSSGLWNDKIVTTIEPIGAFYVAEDYHQNYYNDNPNQGYCTYIIAPKIEKVKKLFKDKLKEDYK